MPGEAIFGGVVLLDAAFLGLAKKKIASQAVESSITDVKAKILCQNAVELFEQYIKSNFDGGDRTWPDPLANRRLRGTREQLNFTM